MTPTPLAAQLGREDGAVDLTLSNPTLAGLAYEQARIAEALARAAPCAYEPHPLGHPAARAAVSDYLGGLGRAVPPERVVLTASTSEGYAVAFKLLCDPGDLVAVPAPSYPLVPHLAELEGVVAVPYRLRHRQRWQIDLASLGAALARGARAVVVVSPNNPTGSTIEAAEAQAVRALCVRYGAAMVIDEVFAPYGFAAAPLPPVGVDGAPPLTLVLDGLSKSAGLPQLKLGWLSVLGAPADVAGALARLEWVLDAYLSVATPVQLAARELLATAAGMQARINARLRRNRATLATALAAVPRARLLAADGGWYGVIELGRGADEEACVTALAVDHGVRVQPGFFYDFADEGYLVVSLLPPEEEFATGALSLSRGLAVA